MCSSFNPEVFFLNAPALEFKKDKETIHSLPVYKAFCFH
jgi:hypothetical protein